MSKRKLTYQDFWKYFSNHLQNKDKHDFEKEIMRDAFEEDAYDGLSKLSQFELGNDIAELKSKILSKAQKRRTLIPTWFKYAASVIILVGIGVSVYFLNSRFWTESLMKEQISQEMEIADSMVLEAEEFKFVTMQDTFKELETKDWIADNKGSKNEKQEIQEEKPAIQEKKEEKIVVVEDDVEIEDELIITDAEVDQDEKMEIVEFEEQEEVVTEEIVEYALQEQTIEVASKGKKEKDKSPNIRIRGATSGSKKETDDDSLWKDAQPPISIDEYKLQIIEKIDYSKLIDFKGEYEIIVSFKVSAVGSLNSFQFENSPHQILNDEIKRVMLELGNWTPKSQKNRSISSDEEITLKIKIE